MPPRTQEKPELKEQKEISQEEQELFDEFNGEPDLDLNLPEDGVNPNQNFVPKEKPVPDMPVPDIDHNQLARARIWWDTLQKTLDDAKCGLNLKESSDVPRLYIFDVQHPNEEDYEITPHYALDPQRRPYNTETITPQEIQSMQSPLDPNSGRPDDYTLAHIYEAACEGRLFVSSQMEAQKNPRQVIVQQDGTSKVAGDFYENTPEETYYGGVTAEPIRPVKPRISFGTRFLAFFGNKEAKRELAQYRIDMEGYPQDMEVYREQKAQWDAIQERLKTDPSFVMTQQNKTIIQREYFIMREDLIGYAMKLERMHQDVVFRNLPEDRRAIFSDRYDKLNTLTEAVTALGEDFPRGRVSNPNEPVPSVAKLDLARVLFTRAQITLGEVMFKKGMGANFHPVTGEALDNAVQKYSESPEFNELFNALKLTDLQQMFKNESGSLMREVDKLVVTGGKKVKAARQTAENLKMHDMTKEIEDLGPIVVDENTPNINNSEKVGPEPQKGPGLF